MIEKGFSLINRTPWDIKDGFQTQNALLYICCQMYWNWVCAMQKSGLDTGYFSNLGEELFNLITTLYYFGML